MELERLNPYIRVAMRSVIKKGITIKQRVIFDYELVYIEDGSFTFYYNGIAYACQKGQWLFIHPGVRHSFDCSEGDVSQPHIHFDMFFDSKSNQTPVSFKDIPELSEKEKLLMRDDIFDDFTQTPYISFFDNGAALEIFFEVIDSFRNNKKIWAKSALLKLIEMLICDNFPSALSITDDALGIAEQMKDFIDSMHGVDITLENLEKQFSYSKFHLEREFKNKYGISLIAYSNDKKMDMARELLNKKTVGETAEELGFSSIYSFSRAFKNRYGISPSGYRRL